MSDRNKTATRRLIVDFENNRFDAQVELLIRRGFFASTVSRMTNLSIGQVRYRSKRAGISALHYRNGQGVEAKEEFSQVEEQLNRIRWLRKTVDQALKSRNGD